MFADRVQADYDALEAIARQFDREGQDVERLMMRIRALVEELERGGWQGRGARAFYDEMYQEVLPALRRLFDALYQASDATMQIIHILRQAETEAGRIFEFDSR